MAPTASREATLALLLAGTAERRSEHARTIAELAAEADYKRLLGLLRAQSLLTLLGSRLEASEGARLPSQFRDALAADREATRRRGSAQAMLAVRWARMLEAEGIPCVPLKGALLGERLYGDLGMRAAGDVDLLVPPGKLHKAVDLLLTDGFAPPTDPVSARGLPELHFRLDDPAGGLPRVELHWRVHWYEESFSRALLERSFPSKAGYRVPEPADELALLLLFFARDAFMGLRQASDVAAWWDTFGSTVAAGALQPIAEEHSEIQPALATAAQVADHLVGLPATDLLDGRPARRRRSRAAARLANWSLSGSRGSKVTNYHLVDWLLSPPGGRGAALRRQLFRQPHQRTGMSRGVEQIRLLLRPPSRLLRSLAGLWRVRGRRSVSPPPIGRD